MKQIKITPSSKMLFNRETNLGKKYRYMSWNNWKHLGSRIYDNPVQIVQDGYYYGICRNFPENGMCLDVFEKCCSPTFVSVIKCNLLSFAELVDIIVIYQYKNAKGKFCLYNESTQYLEEDITIEKETY